MSSVPLNVFVKIVDWTATIDDRRLPATIGFFVELADEQGMASHLFRRFASLRSRNHVSLSQVSDLTYATDTMLDELTRSNPNIRWALELELFRKPTIRLVRPRTFSDFRQLKLDEGSNNLGQVKVPVVLPRAAYVTWFLNRVVHEC